GEPAAAFVGLDMAGPGDDGVPEGVELDLLGVDGGNGAAGENDEVHHASPPAEALRRMRRRGRSMSMASSDDWTRESCSTTSRRAEWLSRMSCPATPRPARWARVTSSSSCWLLRTSSERKRSKNPQRLSTAESRNTLGVPSSLAP